MVISNIRLSLLEENKESDIEYVKRQFDNMRIPYPCSMLGADGGSCLRLRTVKTSSDEPTPLVRIMLLANRTITVKPTSWWGNGDGNSLRDDEDNYSFFHIPPSINKVTLKFTNSNYQMWCKVYTNQYRPQKNTSIAPANKWYSANELITFNASNINYDTWMLCSLKCIRNGGTPQIYGSYRIIYNDEESFKNSLGLQITVE